MLPLHSGSAYPRGLQAYSALDDRRHRQAKLIDKMADIGRFR